MIDLNDLISDLDLIKNSISQIRVNKKYKNQWFVSGEMEYRTSEKRLKEIEQMIKEGENYDNQEEKVKTRKISYDNKNQLQLDLADKISEITGDSFMPRGLFFYPVNGFMEWHTNGASPGKRIYFTHTNEANKSFFRYRDKEGIIHTSYDSGVGWQMREFEITARHGKDIPYWHCIGSMTDRFSMGFGACG